MSDARVHAHGGRLQMPRSRGAASGFLLILFGALGRAHPVRRTVFRLRLHTRLRNRSGPTQEAGSRFCPAPSRARFGGLLLLVSGIARSRCWAAG